MVASPRLVSLFFACFLLIFTPALIFAEDSISVKSSVDKSKIPQDEVLTFKIEISGELNSEPQIELPDLKKDFEIVSTMQSQSLSIKERKINRQADFIYILTPKSVGKFTIGEVKVKIGKEDFKTQSIYIEVTAPPKPTKKELKPETPQAPQSLPSEDEPEEERVIL